VPAAAVPEKTAEIAEAPSLPPVEEAAQIEVVPISSILEDEGKPEEPNQGEDAISAVEKPAVVAQE
jgi:hypothetical protein